MTGTGLYETEKLPEKRTEKSSTFVLNVSQPAGRNAWDLLDCLDSQGLDEKRGIWRFIRTAEDDQRDRLEHRGLPEKSTYTLIKVAKTHKNIMNYVGENYETQAPKSQIPKSKSTRLQKNRFKWNPQLPMMFSIINLTAIWQKRAVWGRGIAPTIILLQLDNIYNGPMSSITIQNAQSKPGITDFDLPGPVVLLGQRNLPCDSAHAVRPDLLTAWVGRWVDPQPVVRHGRGGVHIQEVREERVPVVPPQWDVPVQLIIRFGRGKMLQGMLWIIKVRFYWLQRL